MSLDPSPHDPMKTAWWRRWGKKASEKEEKKAVQHRSSKYPQPEGRATLQIPTIDFGPALKGRLPTAYLAPTKVKEAPPEEKLVRTKMGNLVPAGTWSNDPEPKSKLEELMEHQEQQKHISDLNYRRALAERREADSEKRALESRSVAEAEAMVKAHPYAAILAKAPPRMNLNFHYLETKEPIKIFTNQRMVPKQMPGWVVEAIEVEHLPRKMKIHGGEYHPRSRLPSILGTNDFPVIPRYDQGTFNRRRGAVVPISQDRVPVGYMIRSEESPQEVSKIESLYSTAPRMREELVYETMRRHGDLILRPENEAQEEYWKSIGAEDVNGQLILTRAAFEASQLEQQKGVEPIYEYDKTTGGKKDVTKNWLMSMHGIDEEKGLYGQTIYGRAERVLSRPSLHAPPAERVPKEYRYVNEPTEEAEAAALTEATESEKHPKEPWQLSEHYSRGLYAPTGAYSNEPAVKVPRFVQEGRHVLPGTQLALGEEYKPERGTNKGIAGSPKQRKEEIESLYGER